MIPLSMRDETTPKTENHRFAEKVKQAEGEHGESSACQIYFFAPNGKAPAFWPRVAGCTSSARV